MNDINDCVALLKYMCIYIYLMQVHVLTLF